MQTLPVLGTPLALTSYSGPIRPFHLDRKQMRTETSWLGKRKSLVEEMRVVRNDFPTTP